MASNLKGLISYLNEKYDIFKKDYEASVMINKTNVVFDLKKEKFRIDGINFDRETVFDLSIRENLSTVMLLIKLFERGYSHKDITLEKKYLVGRDYKYLDVLIKNPETNQLYMIEVKTLSEYKKYTNPNNEKNVKQLFSYALQDKATHIASFYTYDFESSQSLFSNVFCGDLLEVSTNVDEFYDRWNKKFDNASYYLEEQPFGIKKRIKQYESLESIDEEDTKILYGQFLTILRLNSISDKPNAFIKMINLFLSKIADETTENVEFEYQVGDSTFRHKGLRFQYIDGETPESFMKRLNSLYKEGMNKYLKMEVIDYTDKEIQEVIGANHIPKLFDMFDDLRLKKNNEFAFIEVHDDKTFLENYEIVKQVVSLLENFKFKYDTKHQFLGDFFEDLLNTSLKQEAGQFFTPYPLVDFMIESLDIKERIQKNIKGGAKDFIPSMIDYACGAGHFLISGISKIQNEINKLEGNTKDQIKKINAIKESPYSWATGDLVVGIEKDYRLAKTTKIATFLNGDGDAEIISGDGINRFNCDEYKNTSLYSDKNRIEKFDYVISNPPYSVEGFMLNFRKNGINKDSGTFSLLNKNLNYKDSAIEIYFVERMEQLLKTDGFGAIILPQSILSQEKYGEMRKFLLSHFKVRVMLLTADITFSGTTTSPVTLILEKRKTKGLDYEVLVSMSPKYNNPTGSKLKGKEEAFLGYKFSTNRSKRGMELVKNSILEKIAQISHQFVIEGKVDIPSELKEYVSVRKLSDLIINGNENYIGDIYPKKQFKEGKSLSNYCKINSRTIEEFDENAPTEYLEIGDLQTQRPSKKKSTKRFCKKGDILVSSLTPRKNQIVIAKGDFMLTTAIHVLSFNDDKIRDKVFEKLRTDDIINQMNALLDGFKATYAKISDQNLYNNILI